MQSVQDVEQHVPVREGEYGERVATVEPGGVEYISLKERHGKPIDLFWSWLSPNLEFATVFVGVLGVAVFGLSFWETALAILIGSALGSATHFVVSSWGPKFGVPMMVESRGAFGFLGNILPAGLNAFTGTIGWFIVNSVSGAFALQALGGLINLNLPFAIAFLIIVVAQVAIATLGHNFIHVFERWALPLLGVVFALATIFIFTKANFGLAANAINIYSGTMSLVALGIREMGMTLRQRRALLAVAAGVLGYIIGIVGQANVGPGSKYEFFLLLISYWIAPWLAVVLVDYWQRKGDYGDESVFYDTKYRRWQGAAAMAIGLVVSVGLFSDNGVIYNGPIPNAIPQIGDLTFIVGFVLTGVLYYAFNMMSRRAPSTAGIAGSRA